MPKKKSLRFEIETVPKEKCVTNSPEWRERWKKGISSSYERYVREREEMIAARNQAPT